MKITILVSGSIRSNFAYRALALARALHMQGNEVSIIAPRADKYNDFRAEKIDEIDGVKILQPFQFAMKRIEINLLPYLFGAVKAVLREKSDLIYIYKPTPINIVGFAAKFFQKASVVVDIDDLGSEVMKIEGHPWYRRKLVEWSEKFALKHVDRLIVASKYLSQKYQKEFPDTPIHIMPNGIEGDWLAPLVPSKEKKRIVFMGSANRRNILEPLFEVLPKILQRHPETKVLIIGDGKNLEYFKQKAKELKISANLEFTGWLDLEEARTRLCAGDIGYNYMPDEPTTKAANNMKISQYMARGVVPLVSDIGDLPAVVDFGRAGYICEADNADRLAEALVRALEDDDRPRKAESARAFASEKFHWNNLAADFSAWLGSPKKTGKKKVYVVSTTVPGDSGGGEIRNYNLIKQLAKQEDIDVEIFCISSDDPKAVEIFFESETGVKCHVAAARPGSATVAARALFLHQAPPFFELFKSSGIGDIFRAVCEKSLPDVVHIEQLHAYYCIRPHIAWLKAQGVKIILDCHNIEFQGFKESLEIFSWPKKMVGKFLTPYLKELEIEATQRADMVFACSSLDATFFMSYNPRTYVVPNGVDSSAFRSVLKNKDPGCNLIFMGGVNYPPNGDAMEFYLKAIHPYVKERMPDVKLLGIGVDEEWLRAIGVDDPSIEPLGFVEDVRPYLAQAAVGICPLRYGSGTRIKIMTYMAAGLPVVSTNKGAEGVTYTNGHDIIMTDNPREFAESILKFLTNRGYRDDIARNGRSFISQNYDWNIIGENLAQIYHHGFR
jgi:glycosyltransferase involved in cell wall biosynthesis